MREGVGVMDRILIGLRSEDFFWLLALPMITWPVYFIVKPKIKERMRIRVGVGVGVGVAHIKQTYETGK